MDYRLGREGRAPALEARPPASKEDLTISSVSSVVKLSWPSRSSTLASSRLTRRPNDHRQPWDRLFNAAYS